MQLSGIRTSAIVLAITLVGCSSSKPFFAPRATGSTPPVANASDASATQAVATSELGNVAPPSGVTPAPKPFIAVPKFASATLTGRPSTLLREHAVPESPVPLSEYPRQPVFTLDAFHLNSSLSAADLVQRLGPPAQLADNDDPWLVYRLTNNRELWLHFVGPASDRLEAADVIRGAEDGYVRDRVFPH